MKSLLVSTLIATGLFASTVSAAPIAGPVVNPSNGHTYYLLSQNTWTASEAEAQTLGGHLATVRSSAENTWVVDQFRNFGGTGRNLWIGYNDVATEGTFVWASGEASAYTRWDANGQPDNSSGVEDYAHIWLESPSAAWNDLPDVTSFQGAPLNGVVEVVPEPSALALIVVVGLLGSRRRPLNRRP